MELTPELVLSGYAQGIFPMDTNGRIYWSDPNPRAIIPLDERFHVSKSLARTIRRGRYTVTFNADFPATMRACAKSAPGRESTWINQEIFAVYCALHEYGFAHSVETWQDGHMVGGLYGVALGGLFAGESMWSAAPDASKVALVALVERLRAGGFVLLDTQWMTDHLAQFGTYEVSRDEYKQLLAAALKIRGTF